MFHSKGVNFTLTRVKFHSYKNDISPMIFHSFKNSLKSENNSLKSEFFTFFLESDHFSHFFSSE